MQCLIQNALPLESEGAHLYLATVYNFLLSLADMSLSVLLTHREADLAS